MLKYNMSVIINEGKQLLIPLTKIKPNPLNSYEMTDLDDLKSSILTYGLITPISVIGPDKDGKYMLIAGERRFHTFEEMLANGDKKYGELPAYVVGTIDMSETEQKLLIEASNLDTRDGIDKHLHYLQVVKLLRQYKEENDLTDSEYLELREQYMKCSPRYARFYEAIYNKGSEELVELTENGAVSISRAGRIANMPEHIQKEAVADLKSGINQDEVVKKHAEQQRKEKTNTVYECADDLDDDFDSVLEEDDIYNDSSTFEDTSFDDDIDFDNMSTDFLGMGVGMEKKNEEIKTVIKWCNKILQNPSPSEDELEAIEACKRVAEAF